MREVKFGLFSITGDYAQALRTAKRADTQGFYSILLNDHFFSPFRPAREPQLECFTTLSAIAAVTTRIRVGSLVAAVAFRSPPLLAKIASTLDHVSNGRLVLGLGAGWEREEYDAHSYPYPSNAERLDQLADAIKLLKVMWTQDEPTYRGTYFSIEKAYNNPRPLQKPHPPIMLGGSGSKLLKIAAAEADIANLIPAHIQRQGLDQRPGRGREIRQGRAQAANRNVAWPCEGGRPRPERYRDQRTKPRDHFQGQEPGGFRRAGAREKNGLP